MDNKNQTVFTEIILLGFTGDRTINILLFILFSVIYSVTVFGNGLIIGIILHNHHLHTPMFYFLCLLSVFDLSYSSTAVPRLLSDLFSSQRAISALACVLQIYVILLLEGCECLLLAIMSYDRYVAICRPLRYHVLMRWSICYKLTAVIFISSFLMCIFPSIFMRITICHNRINHFMCEVLAVVKLACGDISANELVIFSISFVTLLLPFLLIIISYVCILWTVLKIRSAGRSKAFSTCSSHLAVVGLYFGTVMLMYFGPSSQYSTDQEKYSSIFYVIVSPMLNPLIYGLNNKEVKDTIRKLLTTRTPD
ncbi:PREDICTED: olfactory receptor 2A12-like [Nanorana parkeri]|uniref:olfactory receptor 2A12-like n=1 Tax=Nanorana parkeri TaxID=125878 RepID=UPI00085496C7|nr:PREDICTED: olfactory receptor 2A12-like [Nanorana parkeri]